MTSQDTINYLQDHALRNVWCNPFQDRLSTIKPRRLTPYNGVFGAVTILWTRHALPDATSNYHAYQIGQIHPELLGLLPNNRREWTKVSDIMGQRNIIVELFNLTGMQMPRAECYYKWTAEKNLVFIVKDMTHIGVKLGEVDLYIRLYSNNYFHSGLANINGLTDYIYCTSLRITDQATHNQIIQVYNTYYAARGIAVRAYVNGFLVKTLSAATCKVGDTAEVLVDTSIQQVLTYKVSDLLQFHSTRDNKYKYLIKSPTEGTQNAEIIYSDDVDFYLVDSTEPIANKGVYYYQNQPDSVRMVTHVDYSIPVAYLDDFSNIVNAWGGMNPLSLRVFVRKTGNTRLLPNEANRIKELYKLPFDLCTKAMIGIDATVPNWQAATLENSQYAKLMGVDYNAITTQAVEEAYGYNGIGKLVGDSPCLPLTGTTGTFEVPYLMRQYSTAYEYDAAGILIDSYLHINDSIYAARNAITRMVEFIYGRGNLENLYCVYGTAPVNIPASTSFRCYACSVDEYGVSQNNWRDVTDTGSYLVTNGVLTWSLNTQFQQGMVRFDNGFLAYSATLGIDMLGYMVHTMPGADPKSMTALHFVPHAQYDFWLNGHPLVESIDYIQRDYNIVIITKAYLVGGNSEPQKLTVRGVGFCSNTLERDVIEDVGFVKYGNLSSNSIFNVRDDRAARIVANGQLKRRNDFVYTEDAKTFNNLALLNGTPYQIKGMVVPFTKLVKGDVYAMRKQALITDKVVSNYLTLKLPQAKQPVINITRGLYPLYSPFMAAVINSYINGQFKPSILNTEYGDAEVMLACARYEWMLKFDPTQDATMPDLEYAIIHPHAGLYVVEVPVEVFTLFANIIRIYLHNRVTLSTFVSIVRV